MTVLGIISKMSQTSRKRMTGVFVFPFTSVEPMTKICLWLKAALTDGLQAQKTSQTPGAVVACEQENNTCDRIGDLNRGCM